MLEDSLTTGKKKNLIKNKQREHMHATTSRPKIIQGPASSSYVEEKRKHIQEHIYHSTTAATWHCHLNKLVHASSFMSSRVMSCQRPHHYYETCIL